MNLTDIAATLTDLGMADAAALCTEADLPALERMVTDRRTAASFSAGTAKLATALEAVRQAVKALRKPLLTKAAKPSRPRSAAVPSDRHAWADHDES